jgi:hypothetical protein
MQELGLPIPVSVVGNPDGQIGQILGLANREGDELAEIEGGWPALRGEQVFNLVAGTDTYPVPTDFSYYYQGTAWDRTTHQPVLGPLSPEEWQAVKSGLYPAGLFYRFRMFGVNNIVFLPVPANTDTIAIEYRSTNWCQSALGAGQGAFLADTDNPVLPPTLFVLGIKWRFRAAKGLDYSEERAAYDLALARLHPRAFVTQYIAMAGPRASGSILNPGLVPWGNWPGRP